MTIQFSFHTFSRKISKRIAMQLYFITENYFNFTLKTENWGIERIEDLKQQENSIKRTSFYFIYALKLHDLKTTCLLFHKKHAYILCILKCCFKRPYSAQQRVQCSVQYQLFATWFALPRSPLYRGSGKTLVLWTWTNLS